MNIFKRTILNIFRKAGYDIQTIEPENVESEIPEYMTQVKLAGRNNITIIDAGAHHGQTSLLYNQLFTKPQIYAFEPYKHSFDFLQEATANFDNIRAYNYALDLSSGSVQLNVNASSQTNSILLTDQLADTAWGTNLLETKETQVTESMSIDDFVEQHGIERVDILKLDTQGSEPRIIEGASKTIGQNKISIIYMEIITVPTYTGQKNFDEVLLLLRNKGFRLFNLYNFSHTPSGELRQVDGIFIHESFRSKTK